MRRVALLALLAAAAVATVARDARAQQPQTTCFLQQHASIAAQEAVPGATSVCQEIEKLQLPGNHLVEIARMPEGVFVTVIAKLPTGDRAVRVQVARLEDVPTSAPSLAQAIAREQG